MSFNTHSLEKERRWSRGNDFRCISILQRWRWADEGESEHSQPAKSFEDQDNPPHRESTPTQVLTPSVSYLFHSITVFAKLQIKCAQKNCNTKASTQRESFQILNKLKKDKINPTRLSLDGSVRWCVLSSWSFISAEGATLDKNIPTNQSQAMISPVTESGETIQVCQSLLKSIKAYFGTF